MKFRKKPVVIDAERVTRGMQGDLISEGMAAGKLRATDQDTYLIATLEGIMEAFPGDWIIKGIKGEFYPCKPDIFEATYEPV